MDKKVKYPVEGFALAMALYSTGLKDALLVGMSVLFGSVLLATLADTMKDKKTLCAVAAIATAAASPIMYLAAGLEVTTKMILGFVVVGALVGKHAFDLDEETTPNKALVNGLIAVAVFAVLGCARGFLATGKAAFCSGTYGKAMCGLIFAGIFVAIINLILNTNGKENAALYVCLPMIALEAPFVLNNVPEAVGTIIGIVMGAIIYYSFRQKLVFSTTADAAKDIPVEMVLLGMIYMVFTIL